VPVRPGDIQDLPVQRGGRRGGPEPQERGCHAPGRRPQAVRLQRHPLRHPLPGKELGAASVPGGGVGAQDGGRLRGVQAGPGQDLLARPAPLRQRPGEQDGLGPPRRPPGQDGAVGGAGRVLHARHQDDPHRVPKGGPPVPSGGQGGRLGAWGVYCGLR